MRILLFGVLLRVILSRRFIGCCVDLELCGGRLDRVCSGLVGQGVNAGIVVVCFGNVLSVFRASGS